MHAPSDRIVQASELKRLFSQSMQSKLEHVEEISKNLRAHAASKNLLDMAEVHQFEQDAIEHLLTLNPVNSIESEACRCVDRVAETHGIVLTQEYEAFRLQEAATNAPSSSTSGPQTGMMTLFLSKCKCFLSMSHFVTPISNV